METVIPDAPPVRPPEHESHEWNARRWASEFIVIVAGVLAALGANSLWGQHQDNKREHAYIEQLRTDINENVKRLESAIALETQTHEAATAAYEAVARGELVSADSAKAWLITRRGVYYSDPRLLTGTVSALISTGDLRILRDPRVREAVAGYASKIREDRDEFDRFVQSMQPPFEELRRLGFGGQTLPLTRERFGSAVAAITGRPGRDVLMALDGILEANEVRMVYLRRMLETTHQLQSLLGNARAAG